MPIRTDYGTSLLLELDGESILLGGISGGGYSAPIVLTGRKKSLIAVDPMQVRFRAPLTGNGPLPRWIGEFLAGRATSRRIRLLESGRNNLSDLTLDLPAAEIREVSFSPLSATSIGIASVSVAIEGTHGTLAEDVGQPTCLSPAARSPRASAFRLEFPGLPTQFVEEIGEIRARSIDGQTVEVAPIELVIRESHIQPWIDWAKSFIVLGQNSDSDEREAQLSYFPPDLSAPLLQLLLKQVGIASLTPHWGAGQYRVVIYAETIQIV